MARLIKADLAFLERHGISTTLTFDASGLPRSVYCERMKAEGKFAAYGVTRCQRGGHSLRSRHGTCLKCFPATIAFIERANAPGYVYIAQSIRSGLLKVGYSGDQVDNRLYIANLEGLGGCYDWDKRVTWKSKKAGRIEIALHQALSAHAVLKTWPRNGAYVETKEIFDCEFETAKTALENLLNERERALVRQYW